MNDRLERYAELVLRVGANVQPGQEVVVIGQLEHAETFRALARAAYRAGARRVTPWYGDQLVRKALIEHGPAAFRPAGRASNHPFGWSPVPLFGRR